MIHLAIETNFILGMAKGKDAHAFELLQIPPDKMLLVLPSGCIMEAWVAHDKYQATLKQFTEKVNEQIQQVRRNQSSSLSHSLVSTLEESLELHSKHTDQEDRNFREALRHVSQRAT